MSDETFFCYECRRDRPLRLYYDDGLCAECAVNNGDATYQDAVPADAANIAAEKERIAAEDQATFDLAAAVKQEQAERVLARRRLLPFIKRINPDYDPGWVHADICQRLERFAEAIEQKKSPRLMIFMPPRHGKLLADDTPILTANCGWVAHGDLRVGDYVFHPSGRPVEVLAVSDKAPADWVVTFSNGQRIRCHGAHEWTVFDRAMAKHRTVETQWFRRTTKFGHEAAVMSAGRCMYQLPAVGPVDFLPHADVEYPVHPYVLGAWLGDGSRGKGCITHDPRDEAVVDRVEALGYARTARCVHADTGVVTTYFSGPRPGVLGPLLRGLRELEVDQDKHIPEIYLRAPTAVRLDLLAGLIDTDGHCEAHSGRMRFTTSDIKLARGVVDLATTLGFRPYMTVEQPKLSSSGIHGRKEYYVVGFQPTLLIPCVLERKRPRRFAPQRRIGITNVERDPVGEHGHCIQVDSPDGLYLAGTTLVPTHNSEIGSKTFPGWYLGRNPKHEVIACSYSGDLAKDFSRKVRDLLEMEKYQSVFPTRLSKDSKSVERWNTSVGGGFVAAGVQGPITGRGAHCLGADLPIETPRGTITLREVRVGDFVRGFDHVTNTVTWTKVAAIATTRRPRLIDIHGVRCTPDHRFWTRGRGYIQAGWLTKGDGLLEMQPLPEVICPDPQPVCIGLEEARVPPTEEPVLFYGVFSGRAHKVENNVPPVRWGKGRTRQGVSGLLRRETAEKKCGAGVWQLREEVPANQVRVRERAAAVRNNRGLLRARLLSSAQVIKPNCTNHPAGHLSSLPWPGASCGTQVLFPRVLCTGKNKSSPCRVPGVSGRMAVRENAATRARPGVPGMSRSLSLRGSPYRPRCGESRGGEFAHPLSEVPQFVSQRHGDRASDFAGRIQGPGFEVVDLQTGTGNFFVGPRPTLVHNCGIIDDPVKDREEAESETTRQKIKDWYSSTFYTRLAPGGGVLVIQTRWHEDDLSGWLLEVMKAAEAEAAATGEWPVDADRWEVVRYPAIATCDEPFRNQGEALHESRYPLAALQKIKRAMMPRDWEALYQQNPVSQDGDYFTKGMIRYYDTTPPIGEMRIYAAGDLAIGQTEANDYTVFGVIGIDRQQNMYLLDLHRGRWNAMGIIDKMFEIHRRWEPEIFGLETGHIDMTLEPFLLKRMEETGVRIGYEKLRTRGKDKQTRARPIQGRMEQGKVFFPRGAVWTEALITELLSFPMGKHDDQVDCMAWLGQMLLEFGIVNQKVVKVKSFRDKLQKMTRGGRQKSAMAS